MKKMLWSFELAAFFLITMFGCAGQNKSSSIRISEELYVKEASVKWEPYFTGEEPEWIYNPDEPWAWNRDGETSHDQASGLQAHQSLYAYFTECDNYAGCYINSDGYLTVMLTNPTVKQTQEISGLSAAPVWIIAAKYPYKILQKAQEEIWDAITSWISDHPDVPLSLYGGGIDDMENCLKITMQGSGIPRLLSEFDFPAYIEFEYNPTVDASEPHDIPREPNTVWERDGVTIKSARESYPVGTTFILVTASHTVQNQRLYAPYASLRVEKYANGEWYDISGNFFTNSLYIEIFDIPAGEEKTARLNIVTPETLGVGLYRATYSGHVCLSSSRDTTINSAIVGVERGDNVTFEFTVTQDAEPLPLREGELEFSVDNDGKYTGFETLSENYTPEQAIEDGCYVRNRISEEFGGVNAWENFIKNSKNGQASSIRIMSIYDAGVYYQDLFYAEGYYRIFDSSSEDLKDYKYKYILDLNGRMRNAVKDSRFVVLTDDETLTFEDVTLSMISSSTAVIDSISPYKIVLME